MTADPTILLTNDDGIDAPGLAALHDRLSEVGTVRVVAPQGNRSASGRSLTISRAVERGERTIDIDFDAEAGHLTYEVPHEHHDRGYALEATPCDCAIVGIHAFETPDLVVSGCNTGANLGGHVLTRSGTVSAAIESAIAGVPAMAVSMDLLRRPDDMAPEDFATAADVAGELAEYALTEGVFDEADYLNVNVPNGESTVAGAEVTHPSDTYPLEGAGDGEGFEIRAQLLNRMTPEEAGEPAGTDRHALMSGKVSVSPLSVPRRPTTAPTLERFVDRLDASAAGGDAELAVFGE
jgi:5'-nucleotidase